MNINDTKELLFKNFNCDNAIGVYALQRKDTADLMSEMMPEICFFKHPMWWRREQ